MVQKNRGPYEAFAVLLIVILILAYLAGGLCLIPDVNINNIQQHLLFILTHPFQKWWNEKTPGFLGVGLLGWIMFLNYYSYTYRNFQHGKENGSEEWADVERMKKELRDKDDRKNRTLTANISVSTELLSNNNMLVIASSGSYKTTSILMPNLLRVPIRRNSCVVLDVKGELQYKLGKYLTANGIKVCSFNLKEPWLSDRYNPFVWLEREIDLIRLITNLHEAVKKPDAFQGDPFWDDGCKLYLMAIFYYEWMEARDEKRIPTMNNILTLVNEESQRVDSETTKLQVRMNKLAQKKGENHPAVVNYRKLKEGASETVRSIIIMANALLKLCETGDVKRIFEANDINILELGTGVDGNPDKPVVLFLVIPDNDASYNFLISMFYTQMFDVLMRYADNVLHGPLPIPVEFWMDEFYSGAKPSDPEKLLGVIRSRNLSMIPFLQSVAQIKTLFKDAKWETILDNCAAFAYLGSGPGAYSTHEYISNLLGDMTIDTRTDGRQLGRNGHVNENNSRQGRKLMTPSEVRRMSRKNCIIFMEGRLPIYDRKNLPWIYMEKLYKEAVNLNGEKEENGYVHPVKTVYDEQTMTYRTINEKKVIQVLEKKEDIEFYKNAAKADKTIRVVEIDEKDLLYLNLKDEPELTEEEIAALFRRREDRQEHQETAMESLKDLEVDVKNMHGRENVPKSGTEEKGSWNLSGTALECLKRYAAMLTEEEMEEIMLGLEEGLTDKQIKSYFCLPVNKMRQYRRLYSIENRR